jgi:transcriptional regulator with XRE-family HTH domain
VATTADERARKLRVKFGKRCRALRQAAGLSQMDMVRHADFSLSHYQKLERGDLDPRLSTLKKLAGAFDVTISALLEGV